MTSHLFIILFILNLICIYSDEPRLLVFKVNENIGLINNVYLFAWYIQPNVCDAKIHAQNSSNINSYYKRPLIQTISLMGRVFANGPGDWDSISGRVIPDFKNGTWCCLG